MKNNTKLQKLTKLHNKTVTVANAKSMEINFSLKHCNLHYVGKRHVVLCTQYQNFENITLACTLFYRVACATRHKYLAS